MVNCIVKKNTNILIGRIEWICFILIQINKKANQLPIGK